MSLSTPDSEPSESPTPNDSELILQAQGGDIVAFETLYRRYYARISSYLTQLVHDEGIGCELTQDTFIKAWQALPGLGHRSSFVAWLYRIATHKAYDHLRHVRRIQWLSWEEHSLEDERNSSLGGLEGQIEVKEELKAALARLPWKVRACVILYHVEGYTIEQIAEFLDIKKSSVRGYVSLGLKMLLSILNEERTSEVGQD